MLYVVAFEEGMQKSGDRLLTCREDGYARDVTLRYTKTFGAKTAKLRVPTKKDEPDWWSDIMDFLARPNRLVGFAIVLLAITIMMGDVAPR